MKQINDDIFNEEVIESKQPVVVDFSAAWCGPCKRMMPILEQLATENPAVKMVKIDIEESPIATTTFRVDSVPTILFFKNGEAVNRLIGLQPSNRLQESVSQLFG